LGGRFQEALLLQGWATALAPHRGPAALGALLRACCAACLHSGKPGRPDLWERFLVTSGCTDEEADEVLGRCARLIVPVAGPLHM